MSVRFLLACDTFPPNPWCRDRLPAIRKAFGGLNLEIMDIYEFNSREEAHKIHELKGGPFFARKDIDLYDLNEKFYNQIMRHDCNILILGTIDNYAWFLLPETVKKLQEDGIFVVGIVGDCEFTYRRNRLYVPMFDEVIAYVRKYVDYYNCIRPECCLWLPNSCYFPEPNFQDLQIDEDKKKFDVALMGSPFGVRPKLVGALVDAGVNVALFGSAKWREYSDLRAYYHGYIPSEDIRFVIQASKIVLAPLEDHLTGALHMNTKIWDAVKYGQMCIATRYLPLTVDYGLVENKDIVMYDSPDDLVGRVTYYLDNPTERIRIAESLFRKIKERFDYAKMYRDLFQNLEQDFLKKGINGHTDEPIASQVTILDHSRNGEIHPGFDNVRLPRSRGWRQALRRDFQHLVKTPYVILTHGGFSYSPYLNKLTTLFPDEFINGRARLRAVSSKSYNASSSLVDMNAVIWEKDALFNQYVTKRFRYACLFQGAFSHSFANLRLCEANEEGRVFGILVFPLRFRLVRAAMRVARNVARRIKSSRRIRHRWRERFVTSNLHRHMRQRRRAWDAMQREGYFCRHQYYEDWPDGKPPPLDLERALAGLDSNSSYQRLSQVVSLAPTMTVLDIGCGYGRMEEWLCQLVKEVHGVDISPYIIRVARERFSSVDNVQFHDVDGYSLPMFADSMFDLVIAYTVIQHIPRAAAQNYLNSCYRVTKPGGQIVFQYLAARERAESQSEDVGIEMSEYSVRYTAEMIAEQAAAAGLRPESVAEEPVGNEETWLWAVFKKE